MVRQNVISSNLRSVGFQNNILEIEFHGGEVYQYKNVPSGVYSSLINANSLGEYFHTHIKYIYPTTRIY